MNNDRLHKIRAIAFLTVALLFIIGMLSYEANDIRFETSDANQRISNYGGVIGAYAAWLLFKTFGMAAWCIPLLMIAQGVRHLQERKPQNLIIRFAGWLVFLVVLSSLFSISAKTSTLKMDYGGFIGLVVSNVFFEYCGSAGSYAVLIGLFFLSALLVTDFLIIDYGRKVVGAIPRLFKNRISKVNDIMVVAAEKAPRSDAAIQTKPQRIEKSVQATTIRFEKPLINIRQERREQEKAKPHPVYKSGGYKLPSLDLLNSPPPVSQRQIKDDIEANSRILEETLQDFGIEAKVTQVDRGPIVTVYEIQPAPGVKINSITNLADDIALVMKAAGVRIVAPIPGKSRVGIEVPNSSSVMVFLKEALESTEFKESQSRLTLALGKDVAGNPLVGDLCGFPHLLIAGTTGSGKTVCVNSLVASLLFNTTPDEVRLLMIDPKMVELSSFDGVAHLLCPVITEPKKAAVALRWVVQEMESRYKLFAKMGVRNIEIYNEKCAEKMNYIVIIIDELADLMLVASQDIEDVITRLAQLSRAVGIHMILATQRPSVDVVTGVIKANFPARISFQVASKVDSRTVLDTNGADKLVGKGDMLFLKPGESKLIRAQGSLITDAEIERLVEFVKTQRSVSYEEDILKAQEQTVTYGSLEKDPLYDEAKRMVVETGIASVSMLQRRLRLGYTRAARLIDMMEEEGVVGPYRGSKPREILVSTKEVESRE